MDILNRVRNYKHIESGDPAWFGIMRHHLFDEEVFCIYVPLYFAHRFKHGYTPALFELVDGFVFFDIDEPEEIIEADLILKMGKYMDGYVIKDFGVKENIKHINFRNIEFVMKNYSYDILKSVLDVRHDLVDVFERIRKTSGYSERINPVNLLGESDDRFRGRFEYYIISHD